MTNVLEKIIETKKTEVAQLKAKMPLHELCRQAAAAHDEWSLRNEG